MFFAFLSSPFPSHLGQMSSVMQELLLRGHNVEIWGDMSLEQVARRVGSGFHLVPLASELAGGATSYSPRPQDYYARVAFPMVAEQLPRVLELCNEHAPDLIHSNSRIYTAAIASRLTGIACSNHCCSGLSFGLIPEDLFGFQRAGDESLRKHELKIAMNKAFHREIDKLFERTVARPLGLDPIENIVGLSSGDCVLSLSCAELANPRLAALPQTVFTGPLITEDGSADQSQSDYCYVSLGTWPLDLQTTIQMYRMIIAGIPREYRVVVGLGGRCEPSDLAVQDDRVTVLKYAPQVVLVRNALAVVCHGGCQTVHESLYFGKPLVMLPPDLAEPQALSDKVARAGAGIMLDHRKATSTDVQRSVERLLAEAPFVRCAQRLGESLRSAGGVSLAVTSLESIVIGRAGRKVSSPNRRLYDN